MRRFLDALAVRLLRRRVRGAWRFYALACGRQRLPVTTRHGVALRLDPGEFVSTKVLVDGYYEEEVLEAIREDIHPTDVFWDIGACLGIHALTVARLHPAVRVHAFEPNPAMARLIREAADRNAARVEVHALALGARDGAADFFVEPVNAGLSGLGFWAPSPRAEKISVAIATADRLVADGRAPAPTLVKLDAEGSEFDILRGLAGVLRDPALRRIVFEDGTGESGIKAWLATEGFEVRPLLPVDDPRPHLENFVAVR